MFLRRLSVLLREDASEEYAASCNKIVTKLSQTTKYSIFQKKLFTKYIPYDKI